MLKFFNLERQFICLLNLFLNLLIDFTLTTFSVIEIDYYKDYLYYYNRNHRYFNSSRRHD